MHAELRHEYPARRRREGRMRGHASVRKHALVAQEVSRQRVRDRDEGFSIPAAGAAGPRKIAEGRATRLGERPSLPPWRFRKDEF
jgi:hypothetical protein